MMSSRARYCSLWGTDRDRCRVPQSRVGHSRTISYFKRAVRRRATPSGSETQSRFALPTQPTPARALPDGPIPRRKLPAATWMCGSDLVATTPRRPKWYQAESSRASLRTRRRATSGHEIRYDGYRMHARIDGGQVKSLTCTWLDWSHRSKRTIEAASLPQGEVSLSRWRALRAKC
jgi:hypothetical protein